MKRYVCGDMEWPARCLDCGLRTDDPDAYVIIDEELQPDVVCNATGSEHRWATRADARRGRRVTAS